MKKSVALFPYCAELLPVVKYFHDMQSTYYLDTLYAPMGFSLSGEDAGYAAMHPDTGHKVESSVPMNDPQWHTLIISEVNVENESANIAINSDAEKLARRSIQAGKDIVYICNSQDNLPSYMSLLLQSYSERVSVRAFGDEHRNRCNSSSYNKLQYLYVPVILVGGVLEDADTFHVMTSLAHKLRQERLNVSVVTKHPAGGLLGFHVGYSLLQDKSLTEVEKIIEMNHSLKTLEISELPDVILMEAPSVLMKFNDEIPNDFGIFTYMLSQAIVIDYLICCVPLQMGNKKFILELSNDFQIKLGSSINATHISNVVISSVDTVQNRRVSYTYTDMKEVFDRLVCLDKDANESTVVFNIVQKDGIDMLCKHIFFELALTAERGMQS